METKILFKKKCKCCGKEFIPRTNRQIYCDGPHYKPCPVCGKLVEKAPGDPATACSKECRMKLTQQTCMSKYGNVNVLNSEHGKSKARNTSIEKYGVDRYQKSKEFRKRCSESNKRAWKDTDLAERVRQTNLQKYGGSSPMCSEDVKAKAKQSFQQHYNDEDSIKSIIQKRRESCEEKYGGLGFSSSVIRDKCQDTLKEHYGDDPWKYDGQISQKRKETCLEKYGCDNALQNKDIRAKSLQSLKQHYGQSVENPMDVPELVEKSSTNRQKSMVRKYGVTASMLDPNLKEKISSVFQEKYGVPWYVLVPGCNEHNNVRISSSNKLFSTLLNQQSIQHIFEFGINYDVSNGHSIKWYDIKIEDSPILIEIDPTYTHNVVGNHWSSGLEPNYHLDKSQIAWKNGYRCIHVFDWDDVNRIVQLIGPKKTIYARKCDIKSVDQFTAEQFTRENHLQGSCRGQKINYGLYYEGELVELMTFGTPRYNRNCDLELLRLCTKSDLKVVGGASKLFKAFRREHSAESVISYCDLAKFSGEVYSRLGMTLNQVSEPAKVWSKGRKYITDNLLRQRGYDQLFGTNYGKGTSNEELMLKDGWLPVYDCGQAVYIDKPCISS